MTAEIVVTVETAVKVFSDDSCLVVMVEMAVTIVMVVTLRCGCDECDS